MVETPPGPSNTNPMTRTPLSQRPQTAIVDGKADDCVPETQATPDLTRRLSMSSGSREQATVSTPTAAPDRKKHVLASPLTKQTGGYVHIPPRTNINETKDWRAYRVILLDTIDHHKWWGKLVDYSPNQPPIPVERPYW